MSIKHKKLIYAKQSTLDKWIEVYKSNGWRVAKTYVKIWPLSKCKAHIAELEKD